MVSIMLLLEFMYVIQEHKIVLMYVQVPLVIVNSGS